MTNQRLKTIEKLEMYRTEKLQRDLEALEREHKRTTEMLKKKSPPVSRKPSTLNDSGISTKRSGALSEDPYVRVSNL